MTGKDPEPRDSATAHASTDRPRDTLNSIGVLKRREIEARIIGPLVDAMSAEFGRERVLGIVRETIARIAREQGSALAEAADGNSLTDLARSLGAWRQDNALEIHVLEQSEEKLSFNVTRCRYAEMYRALGIPELGALLSCNRDGALIAGFNPDVEFDRTQTIMQGAPHCDFRYRAKRCATETEQADTQERESRGRP